MVRAGGFWSSPAGFNTMNPLQFLQEALQKACEAYNSLDKDTLPVLVRHELNQLDMALQDSLGIVNNCVKRLERPTFYK